MIFATVALLAALAPHAPAPLTVVAWQKPAKKTAQKKKPAPKAPASTLSMTVTSDGKPVAAGATIGLERPFRVSVATDTAIGSVEFYVGDELRDTDTSTPYEFKLDTVSEKDGPLKLRFKATTVENKSVEKALTVNVDNEVAKGAAFHVAKANDLLAESKFADARDQGRIAMKAEKGYYDARIALARAYTGLGELDQAQLQAEEAKADKPNDPIGLSLLAGINVRRAFLVYAKPGADRAAVLKEIKEAYSAGVAARQTALDALVEANKLDPANPLPYADAALRAGRYQAVVTALSPAFDKNQSNADIADRLAYAQIRSNRFEDAAATLNALGRAGSLSAYGFALRAALLADKGDDVGSDAAMREAVLADDANIGVRTAQTFIALKRNRPDVLARLSADLAKEQGQRADVRYFQMAVAAKQQRYSDADKAFRVGVLAEPAMADLFVEYANDAIAITQRNRPVTTTTKPTDGTKPVKTTTGGMDPKEKAQHYAEARAYFEIALVARPDASDALSGLAMVALFENKPDEALRYAQAAVAASPGDAGAHYALSAAQAANRDPAAAASNNRAGRLDPKYLEGRTIPDADAVWAYLDTAGRPTVIAAP